MILSVVVVVALALASFFGWSYIHEISHVLMAKKLIGLQWYKLKLYPHKYKDTWRWAAVEYLPVRNATEREQAWISIAPRFPGIFAALMFVFTGFMSSGLLAVVWAILWGSGLVDMFVGSVGTSQHSDIHKAAKGFKQDPLVFRLVGLTIIALSILTAVFIGLGG